jgi:hypothetical protein
MPEWLELELAHHLAPVEAPPALTWQALEPRRPRRSFTLLPILAAAAAVAVLILAAPRGASSPEAVNRYLDREAGIRLAIPRATRATIERVRILHENGGRIAAVTWRLRHTEATVLIARAGTVRGPEWRPHGQNYAIASADPQFACLLCHGI